MLLNTGICIITIFSIWFIMWMSRKYMKWNECYWNNSCRWLDKNNQKDFFSPFENCPESDPHFCNQEIIFTKDQKRQYFLKLIALMLTKNTDLTITYIYKLEITFYHSTLAYMVRSNLIPRIGFNIIWCKMEYTIYFLVYYA